MSCAGKGYGTNPQSDSYLYSQFYSSTVTNSVTQKTSRKCRKFKGFYPNFTPSLNNMSITTSIAGSYAKVYVDGYNFLPNGTTVIQFGNYGYLPIIFYSSFNISFIVPINAVIGSYNVRVVNIYNGNFSPQLNQTYPGILNFSNSITYNLT
jgi:hypothetical protein